MKGALTDFAVTSATNHLNPESQLVLDKIRHSVAQQLLPALSHDFGISLVDIDVLHVDHPLFLVNRSRDDKWQGHIPVLVSAQAEIDCYPQVIPRLVLVNLVGIVGSQNVNQGIGIRMRIVGQDPLVALNVKVVGIAVNIVMPLSLVILPVFFSNPALEVLEKLRADGFELSGEGMLFHLFFGDRPATEQVAGIALVSLQVVKLAVPVFQKAQRGPLEVAVQNRVWIVKGQVIVVSFLDEVGPLQAHHPHAVVVV